MKIHLLWTFKYIVVLCMHTTVIVFGATDDFAAYPECNLISVQPKREFATTCRHNNSDHNESMSSPKTYRYFAENNNSWSILAKNGKAIFQYYTYPDDFDVFTGKCSITTCTWGIVFRISHSLFTLVFGK